MRKRFSESRPPGYIWRGAGASQLHRCREMDCHAAAADAAAATAAAAAGSASVATLPALLPTLLLAALAALWLQCGAGGV